MRVVDLSHPVKTGMQVFPGDPSVSCQVATTVEQDGFEVTELHLGTHSGTHMDAPSHIVAGGATIGRSAMRNAALAAGHPTGEKRLSRIVDAMIDPAQASTSAAAQEGEGAGHPLFEFVPAQPGGCTGGTQHAHQRLDEGCRVDR